VGGGEVVGVEEGGGRGGGLCCRRNLMDLQGKKEKTRSLVITGSRNKTKRGPLLELLANPPLFPLLLSHDCTHGKRGRKDPPVTSAGTNNFNKGPGDPRKVQTYKTKDQESTA